MKVLQENLEFFHPGFSGELENIGSWAFILHFGAGPAVELNSPETSDPFHDVSSRKAAFAACGSDVK